MTRNMMSRVLVAAVAVPLVIWGAYQPPAFMAVLVLALLALCAGEFLWAEKIRLGHPLFWAGLIGVLIAGFAVTLQLSGITRVDLGFSRNPYLTALSLMLILIWLSGFYARGGGMSFSRRILRSWRFWFGLTYLLACWTSVFWIRQIECLTETNPSEFVLLFFVTIWVSDTAAMLTGKAIGKHKLTPKLSPRKTLEGSVGAIVFSGLAAYLIGMWRIPEVSAMLMIGFGVGVSVIGQAGDALQSAWKRHLKIKDSSGIIPGHGGVLDRFDALLLAAPFALTYISYVICQ